VIVAPHRGLEPRHRSRIEAMQIRWSRPAGVEAEDANRQRERQNDRAAAHRSLAHDGPPVISSLPATSALYSIDSYGMPPATVLGDVREAAALRKRQQGEIHGQTTVDRRLPRAGRRTALDRPGHRRDHVAEIEF